MKVNAGRHPLTAMVLNNQGENRHLIACGGIMSGTEASRIEHREFRRICSNVPLEFLDVTGASDLTRGYTVL